MKVPSPEHEILLLGKQGLAWWKWISGQLCFLKRQEDRIWECFWVIHSSTKKKAVVQNHAWEPTREKIWLQNPECFLEDTVCPKDVPQGNQVIRLRVKLTAESPRCKGLKLIFMKALNCWGLRFTSYAILMGNIFCVAVSRSMGILNWDKILMKVFLISDLWRKRALWKSLAKLITEYHDGLQVIIKKEEIYMHHS